MSSARFFLYCLILLSGDSVWSKMCRWTQFQLGSKNEECVSLLYQMGGNFPLGCLNEKGTRLFPAEAYRDSQNADVSGLALEVLENTYKIFQKDQSKVESTWNPVQLELFRNILHRQIGKLRGCVGNKSPSTSTASATIKLHFEKLNAILTEKEFSLCAWEIVRDEIHYNLDQFSALLKNKQQK